MTDEDIQVVVATEEAVPVVLAADVINFSGGGGGVGDLEDRLDDVEDSLTAEASTRASADASLDSRLATVEGDYTTSAELSSAVAGEASARSSAISAEATARASADSAESSTRAAAVAAEASARASADASLDSRLSAVEGDYATSSELSSAVAGEASARAAADTAIDGRLDAIEADYATSADVVSAIEGVVGAAPESLNTLEELSAQLAIDENAAAALTATVAAETAARISADSDLDARLDVIEAADYATSSEVTATVAAEAALARDAASLTSGTIADARIPSTIARDSEVTSAVADEASTRAAAVAAEASTRASADASLDSRIATVEGDYTTSSDLSSALAGKQDSSAELTAIAALSGTTYGRGFIPLADSTAAREKIRIFAGTSATSSGTVAKTATITGLTPTAGDILYLTFTNGNSATSPTLNINSGGAKNIFMGGTGLNSANMSLIGSGPVALMYDGTQWQLLGALTPYGAASQAEMEAAGVTSIRWMTPQRVGQAIAYLAPPKREAIQSITASGNYNLLTGDERTILEFSHATVAQAAVIPTDATINFSVTARFTIARFGAAAVTIDGSLVTLYSPTSSSPVTSVTVTRNGEAYLRKRSANTWAVTGDVT